MSKLALIIPVFNGEAYLAELLNSVLAQTEKSWECILVDDGSTDTSPKILAEYSARDSRFHLITQHNLSCGTARNNALSQVLTPFVMFADQDDLLHPEAFEIALRHAERAHVDCLLFGFSRFTEAPDFRSIAPNWEIRFETRRQGFELITGHRRGWPIYVWRHIFRTEAVKAVPFPPISGGEDQAWMAELSWRNLSWASIEPQLYANRERADSRSRALSSHYIRNVFTSYDWMRERAKLYNLDARKLNGFIRHMKFMFELSIIYRRIRSIFA